MDIDFGAKPRSSDGVHFANVGGMWQEVVLGFCGLVSALNTDVLTFNPCLPEEIKEISIKIIWKGSLVGITVKPQELIFMNLSEKDIVFNVMGRNYAATADCTMKVEW
jgi:trehalose/maltose hydrolase-like predicted phosphorylase